MGDGLALLSHGATQCPVPSPVHQGAVGLAAGVVAIGMPTGNECDRKMFVMIRWGERKLAVPLTRLDVIEADDQPREAVKVWHYWVGMGLSEWKDSGMIPV